ncbi:MAG: hypothetical protein R3264_06330 [Anaerolineae bacterium]|nr:hypothetical protein [Anaerolineae bacterium]
MLNRIKVQVTLALFWFASAYLAMGAIISWEWAWRCAWFNMIIGLVGLLFLTRTETLDRFFYRGPGANEPGYLLGGFLWIVPIIGFFVAGLWWILRLIGIFNW